MMKKPLGALFACLAAASLLPLALQAQAPLDVIGVTDKAYNSYSGQASFRVPSAEGYSYRVLLDGQPVPTDVSVLIDKPDYHEVSVWRTNASSGVVTNRLVRFIVSTPGRGTTEHGIPTHFPSPLTPSAAGELSQARLRLIAPQNFPVGYDIPVVAWVVDEAGHAVRANGSLGANGHPSIAIKRGVGSGFLAATNPAGPLEYSPQIQGLGTNRTINLEVDTVWTTVSGALATTAVWPENSRIHVTGHLFVTNGATLTIGPGAIVRLNAGVNITNNGSVIIDGTVEQPVVFMPNSTNQPWGGFFMRTSGGLVQGSGVIFTGSSADPNGGAGHRSEQCLFLCDSTPTVNLTDSAAIFFRGQLAHAYNGGTFKFTRFLLQRCITGGEYTGANFTANDCAFIEFPDDTVNYVDGDNDALYFVSGSHAFTNTLFGWTKDDGIDSGGSGYGPLRYQSCWFEATFHEGNSLSGYKDTRAWDTIYIDCGQGLEDGYNAPTCRVDRCLFLGNKVGLRHGDNYDNIGAYDGRASASNSIFLQNHHDVWGYNWRSAGWTNSVGQMAIGSNFLSALDTNFPQNSVWSPAEDFWRLTNWMTIPGEAAVGCGVAVWTDRFGMSEIFGGLPVRLSHFTTNFVGVDYAFEDTSGVVLGTGRLEFAPGETVKRIYPAGFDVWRQSYVKVVLTGAQNGEVTGRAEAEYVGSGGAPQISCWAGTNQMGGYRMAEGMLVRLSVAGGQPVSVDYAYEAPAGTQKTGTLVFAPGETVKWADPSGVGGYEWVRLNLSGAEGGTLAGISSVLYTNPPLTVGFGVGASPMNVSAFSNGLPVVLSAPASAGVIVDFQYEAGGAVLTNGTLSFGAGQGLRVLSAPTVESQAYELIKVSLKGAQGAELAGVSNVYYLGGVERNDLPIALNAAWRYRDAASAAPANWNTNTFDHSGWPEGPAQLGFSEGEEGDEATLIGDNNQITSYFRRFFTVADPAVWTNLTLRLLRDDGGVVYLNGREVFRSPNLPSGTVTYSTTTGSPNGENTIDTATISTDFLRAGENLCAVEIHQASATSSDVSFALELKGNGAAVVAPAIVGPTNGQVFELGQSVGVSVNGGSASQGVVLYADTRAVATNAAGPYQYEVSGLGAGGHELVAVGLGTGGLRAMSAPVAIEVVGQDRDGDGMPDGWESAHGLNPDADDAELDLDGDGLKNGAEYVAGTDPQDPKSYLKIEKLEGAQGGGWGVTFEAVAGKSYAVEHAPGLPAASWTLLTNLTAAATGPITVSDSASASNRYYRIRIP